MCTKLQGHSVINSNWSSVTTRPIEAKFHVEPPWDEEEKICSNGSWSHDQGGRRVHIW